MKGLTSRVLDWTHEKFDEIYPDDKHPYLKAFGCGALEGLIDGAVIWFPIALGAAYYWKHKATKK